MNVSQKSFPSVLLNDSRAPNQLGSLLVKVAAPILTIDATIKHIDTNSRFKNPVILISYFLHFLYIPVHPDTLPAG